jgi:hypothetical protein
MDAQVWLAVYLSIGRFTAVQPKACLDICKGKICIQIDTPSRKAAGMMQRPGRP